MEPYSPAVSSSLTFVNRPSEDDWDFLGNILNQYQPTLEDLDQSLCTSRMPDFQFPSVTSEENMLEVRARISGLSLSEANQVEIFEGLDQSKRQGGRAKLTPDQKGARKRCSDLKWRLKKKLELQQLTATNSFLRAEYDRLTDEIRKLKSDTTSLHPNRQFPAQDPKELESYIPQSGSQMHDTKSFPVQDHHGTNSGAADKIPITAVDTDLQATYDRLMQKLEADDESNVCFSDFKALDGVGELIQVGKYSFPLPLHPVVKKINDVYGDVSATSKVNLHMAEVTYILFCASVKEMDELQLEQVTLDRILKWNDAIKDSLRIHFRVEFAMEHLKKIALAYIGRMESRELESMNESISKLEADLNTRREEVAKKAVQCKKYIDAAKGFNGKTLSLFPQPCLYS